MAASKFNQVASSLRRVIPAVDDRFWNFYRNVTMAQDVQPIVIPYRFSKGGKMVAEAAFRCLPSPHDMAGLGLACVLKAHPKLDWDAVAINDGPERERAFWQQNLDRYGVMRVVQERVSVFGMMVAFDQAVRAIDPARMERAQMQEAYSRAQNDLALRIGFVAHDVQWKKGGPGFLARLGF